MADYFFSLEASTNWYNFYWLCEENQQPPTHVVRRYENIANEENQ